jgi:hypothetical protein
MKKSLLLFCLILVLFFGFKSLSFAEKLEDVKQAQPGLSAQKELPQKNVLPSMGGRMVPAVSPDFEVRIVSVGTATATNRDPFTGRIEDASGPEEMIPIYVTIPFSVAVRNGGRQAGRPIRVSIESEGGMPPTYRTFGFSVAGSTLPSMVYFDEPLAPGAERTFSGTIYSQQFTLPLYRSDAEHVTMRFRAVVDPEFSGHPSVAELNERNNTSAWSMPMNLPPAAITGSLPDLTMRIDEIRYKETLPHGGDPLDVYDIYFTMFNNGTARYRGNGGPTLDQAAWSVEYFAESNRRFHPDGWALLAYGGCSAIEPGASSPLRVDSADLPVDTTKIRVTADPRNKDDELNEANNTAEKTIVKFRTPERVVEPLIER